MRLTPDNAVQALRDYCSSNIHHPYFVSVDGSADIKLIVSSLPGNFKKVHVSDFCGEDSLPDFDRLIEVVSNSIDNLIIMGLGETCFLTDEKHIHARLKDLSISQRVVVICRHGEGLLGEYAKNDSKFTAYRWCAAQSNADYSVIKVAADLKIDSHEGYRSLLRSLEDGKSGKIYVRTNVSMVNCTVINSAYDAIRAITPSFIVPRNALTDEMWDQYLGDNNLEGYDLKTWRYYLKMYIEGASTPYLRLVMRLSPDYKAYKKQLLCAILSVNWDTSVFKDLCLERKSLLTEFKEYEIEEFVIAAKERDAERIHYLTDTTLTERRAIIEEISTRKRIPTPEEMAELYPALLHYLHTYQFSCKNGIELSRYFEDYKCQKLLNTLEDSFRQLVDEMSEPSKRLYTDFQTRKQVLAAEKVGLNNPGLYWLDALGVEYLGYIQELAKQLDLSIKVSIAKASLPTLTCYNREFYIMVPLSRPVRLKNK